MSGATIDLPLDTGSNPLPLSRDQAVVAAYRSYYDAETAVRLLARDGLPTVNLSLIGRGFETREDVQGFYCLVDAAREGAQAGAWFGGFFGLLHGIGLFVLPVMGGVFVMGPLAGLVAGAINGAGVGALINGLISLGIPENQAIRYQARLHAGEFLVVVHGATTQEIEQTCAILPGTPQVSLHISWLGSLSDVN